MGEVCSQLTDPFSHTGFLFKGHWEPQGLCLLGVGCLSSLLNSVHTWCVHAAVWTTQAATYLVKLHPVIPSSGKGNWWREKERKKEKNINQNKTKQKETQKNPQTNHIWAFKFLATYFPIAWSNLTKTCQHKKHHNCSVTGFKETARFCWAMQDIILKSTSPSKSRLTAGKNELFNPPSYLPFPKPVMQSEQAVPFCSASLATSAAPASSPGSEVWCSQQKSWE